MNTFVCMTTGWRFGVEVLDEQGFVRFGYTVIVHEADRQKAEQMARAQGFIGTSRGERLVGNALVNEDEFLSLNMRPGDVHRLSRLRL
jgi:hypothetical protein